jgi:antitoxin FitA
MEEEIRNILRNAAREEQASAGGLGTEIASLFAKIGLKEEIPELHGDPIGRSTSANDYSRHERADLRRMSRR